MHNSYNGIQHGRQLTCHVTVAASAVYSGWVVSSLNEVEQTECH